MDTLIIGGRHATNCWNRSTKTQTLVFAANPRTRTVCSVAVETKWNRNLALRTSTTPTNGGSFLYGRWRYSVHAVSALEAISAFLCISDALLVNSCPGISATNILGPLKSRLQRELGTSNTEFGLLLAAYSLNSTWTPLVGGVLASRLGTTMTSILATGIIFLGMFAFPSCVQHST